MDKGNATHTLNLHFRKPQAILMDETEEGRQ